MDQSIEALQRAATRDSEDSKTREALVRALLQRGGAEAAYEALILGGEMERAVPGARRLGAELAVKEAATLKRGLGCGARIATQRHAGDWVWRSAGGSIEAALPVRAAGVFVWDRPRVRFFKALERFRFLQSLTFSCRLTNNHISQVPRLPLLREVRIHGGERVTNAALFWLAELPALSELSLDCSKITAAGLAFLAPKPLKSLCLGRNTPTNDAVLEVVSGFQTLRRLEIQQLGSEGCAALPRLAALPELRALILQSWSLRDDDLSALSALPALTELTIDDCEDISLRGLEGLRGARSLRVLSARGLKLREDLVRQALPQLRSLAL